MSTKRVWETARAKEENPFVRYCPCRQPGKILPEKNTDRESKVIRKTFGLTHDVCRHSWFTYFVAKFDSFAKAAKEGGNSEQIVKEHYESPAKKRGAQAKKFWSLNPPRREAAKIIPFRKERAA